MPKTPEEYLGVLQKIKDNTDAIPLYTNFAAGWTMGAWDAYIGGSATGDADFMNDKVVHGKNPFADRGDQTGPFAVYNTLYEAVSRGLVEDDPTTTDWEGCKGMINNGEIATLVLGSWAVTQMQEAGDNGADIGYMPFPITVGGKQYASAGPDYCYGVNINSTEDEKIASLLYVKWLTEESNFAYDEGGIPIVKGAEYPPTLVSFDGIELVIDNPSPAGEETLFNDVNIESEVGINNENTHVQRIVEAAMDQSETMQDIVEDWNTRWSEAQEKLNIQVAE
jgi:ABC-type glycerol-3-phosphate transport system substrate-binding protein